MKYHSPSPRRPFSRLAVCLLIAVGLVQGPALATWSIVVINRATGEVAIGTATCLQNFVLRGATPVIRVGRGVAAAQSFLDPGGTNRARIWNGFINHLTPEEILAELAATDPGHQTRQYGIVSFDGPPVTFTGTVAGAGTCELVGESGDLVYAIQGNVITGDPVCLDAELALIQTPGDLGQKVMAAMEAARARGGDGRCSCLTGAPNSCGSPPPVFTKSAHTGFVLVARPGDTDDPSCPSAGCAGGDYYLELENWGDWSDPDPVFVLQDMYDQWRVSKAGIVDHTLTEVALDAQRIVADGVTTATVTIRLRDIEGNPISAGTFSFPTVQIAGDPIATVGQATHLGGDTYAIELTATTTPGRAAWNIVVNDGMNQVQLYPSIGLESVPPSSLTPLQWDFSALDGGTPRVVLNLGPANAAARYHLYASLSGTSPGTMLGGGLIIPLNRDRLFDLTALNPTHAILSGFVGLLDTTGRAEASITLIPGALASVVGARMDFCAVYGSAGAGMLTEVAGLTIVP